MTTKSSWGIRLWLHFLLLTLMISSGGCKLSKLSSSGELRDLSRNNLGDDLGTQCRNFLASSEARELRYSESLVYAGLFRALSQKRVPLNDAADFFANRIAEDFLHFSDLAYSGTYGTKNFRKSPKSNSFRLSVRAYVALLGPTYYGTLQTLRNSITDVMVNNPLGQFAWRMREGAANMGDQYYETHAVKYLTGLKSRRGIELHDLMLLYMMTEYSEFFHVDDVLANRSAGALGNTGPEEIFITKTSPSLACNNHAAAVLAKPIPWSDLGMDAYSGVGFISWFHEPVARFRHEYPMASSLIPVFGAVFSAGDSLLSAVEGRDANGNQVGKFQGSAMFAFHFSIAVLEAFAVKASAVKARDGVQRILTRTKSLNPSISGLSEMSAVLKDEAMRIGGVGGSFKGRNIIPCALASVSPGRFFLDHLFLTQTAFAAELPCLKNLKNISRLHQNISNAERIDVINDVRVADLMSAPGHKYLRDPSKVVELAKQIEKTGSIGLQSEPIVLNVFTSTTNTGAVAVRSIEVIDGNHRIAAGLLSGRWKTVGDIPKELVKVKVNGWSAGGSFSEPRWIPLEIAEKSSIPREAWFRVPDHWQGVKGATAQIPGDVASIDSVVPLEFRGVRLQQVLDTSLKRINAGN